MNKVITFSRVFPAYHPKAGQPTWFPEKIWGCLFNQCIELAGFIRDPEIFMRNNQFNRTPKLHTIRSGNSRKEGDWFKPKIWGDDVNPKSQRRGPYHSKQIQFAPEIKIKRIYDIEVKSAGGHAAIYVDGWAFYQEGEDYVMGVKNIEALAKNDGLSVEDLKAWFKWPTPFTGQIICWDENVNY